MFASCFLYWTFSGAVPQPVISRMEICSRTSAVMLKALLRAATSHQKLASFGVLKSHFFKDLTGFLTQPAAHVILVNISCSTRYRGKQECRVCTHTVLVSVDFIGESSEALPCRQLYTRFPRHLHHVSFLCGGQRKWNGKTAPPPSAATWQGRRAVGQEPAGHSRAYLWSAFSSAAV